MKKICTLIILFWCSFSSFSQNNPPVAVSDSVTVISQAIVEIDALSNDYDPDGDSYSIRSWFAPKHGVADTIEGAFRYQSNYFVGKDSITYRIRDNGIPPANSDYATIYIDVLENPDVPVAVTDTFNLLELVPVNLDILENDFDPNGDEIIISKILNSSKCDVIISEDSSFVIVIPYLGFSNCSFTYFVKEANSEEHFFSSTVLVWINILVNPDIPVIVDDEAETIGGTAVNIPVLSNDVDPQGDELEILDFSQPGNGFATQSGNNINYLPPISFMGDDQFAYRIREINDTNIYSDYATVTVHVYKNPNCPVGVPDSAYGTIYIPTEIDVLPNDYDDNGDPFEIMDTKSSSGATITVENNLIHYQSSPLASGYDIFYYRIRQTNDPLYYSEWTPVYVELADNPTFPVAVADFATARAGLEIFINPMRNDIANNSDSLRLLNFGSPRKGRANRISDSVITYVSFYQASGKDSLWYFINDKNDFYLIDQGLIYVDIIDNHFYDSLEVNNISAGVNANGMLFSAIKEIPNVGLGGDIEAHFKFPKSSTKHTIFSNSIWLGGFDELDSLHVAAERYKQVGVDYQVGPIADSYDTNFFLKYGRTWKISKQEVEYHRNNFWKEGYQPLEAISSWPGNGDPSNGEALQLAPYGDFNNDGIYNAMDGDYPLIRGDQTIFLIFNDDRFHSETQGARFRVEIHGMVYGFNSPADSVLNNTVFVHYDLINRSGHTYSDFYAGIFSDLEIGYAWDDYVGCDVSAGSFYAYNGHEIDGNGELEAYGENPPAQSVTILAGPYLEPDGYDDPSGGCDESINGLFFGNGIADDERMGMTKFIYFSNTSSNPATTDPAIPREYYYYLTGRWKDQSMMQYGGTAHSLDPETVGPDCNFMFPGLSDPMNWGTGCEFPNGGYNQDGKYWTEEESENVPGDRRGLGVVGPFVFEPGDVEELEIAYCAANGWNGPLSSLEQLFENINTLIQQVEEGDILLPNNSLGIVEYSPENHFIEIFPNPASSKITVMIPSMDRSVAEFIIYNVLGNIECSGMIDIINTHSIDISALHSGIYTIIIHSNFGSYTGRFIKF